MHSISTRDATCIPPSQLLTPSDQGIVCQNGGIPREARGNRSDRLWHGDWIRSLVDSFALCASRWNILKLSRVHILVHTTRVYISIHTQEQGMRVSSIDGNNLALISTKALRNLRD
jgi:hypothetical protein